MESKWFGLIDYCVLPECPAYGLHQEPLESISLLNQCNACRKIRKETEMFEVNVDGSLIGLCNKCLHKEIVKFNGKKNTKKL